MKILIIISFLASFQAFGGGRELWPHINMRGKITLLQEYQAFFNQLQTTEPLDKLESMSFNISDFVISPAWAESAMNCVYAGWPSKRINNLCSSPVRHNPDYSKGNCGANQLQCQPLLFGKGVCVSVASQKERSLAFTNCDLKKKISPEALVKEIRADGNEKALFELMDFADKICKEGSQRGTGMCKRLIAVTEKLRHFKPQGEIAVTSKSKAHERGPAVTTSSRQSSQEKQSGTAEQREIIQTVTKANEAVKGFSAEDCEVVTNGEPFDRDEPRPLEFDFITSRQGQDPAWDNNFVKDKNSSDLRPTGFEITNIGPNSIAGEPIDPRERSERKWRFVSDDNSKRETYLWITDDSGSGYISGLMDTVIMIVPRRMKQKIETVGNDLHVTLTTGEKVIYDKNTKMIKGGVLKEGKVDANPNKHARKFAPITYGGSGITIRVDKRGEDPRLISGNAVIGQNGKSCQVPAKELWDNKGDFKYSDDGKLLELLNRKCGKKFSI